MYFSTMLLLSSIIIHFANKQSTCRNWYNTFNQCASWEQTSYNNSISPGFSHHQVGGFRATTYPSFVNIYFTTSFLQSSIIHFTTNNLLYFISIHFTTIFLLSSIIHFTTNNLLYFKSIHFTTIFLLSSIIIHFTTNNLYSPLKLSTLPQCS